MFLESLKKKSSPDGLVIDGIETIVKRTDSGVVLIH